MKTRLWILMMIGVGLGFLGFSLSDRTPKLLYNPSPSAPVGWYRVVETDAYKRGDLVAAWLSKDAEQLASARGYLPEKTPVIKRIEAIPGDVYCVDNNALKLGDGSSFLVLPTDSKGREMPTLPGGCRSLSADEYLILSDRVNTSFDSRYYGPVRERALLGRVEYMEAVEAVIAPGSWEKGGARGSGAQGKIKGLGVITPLKACLHIYFYSVIAGKLVSGLAQITRGCWDTGSVISRSFFKAHRPFDP